MADLEVVATNVAQSEQVVTITIYQPNEEPYKGPDGKDVTISVVGKESKAYIDAENAIVRRASKQRRQASVVDNMRQNRIDLAAACITGWSGWESGGKPFPFTTENAKKLLGTRHILEQVEQAIGEHAANFTKTSTSSPTSSNTSAG
jgi:hypothetical protein